MIQRDGFHLVIFVNIRIIRIIILLEPCKSMGNQAGNSLILDNENEEDHSLTSSITTSADYKVGNHKPMQNQTICIIIPLVIILAAQLVLYNLFSEHTAAIRQNTAQTIANFSYSLNFSQHENRKAFAYDIYLQILTDKINSMQSMLSALKANEYFEFEMNNVSVLFEDYLKNVQTTKNIIYKSQENNDVEDVIFEDGEARFIFPKIIWLFDDLKRGEFELMNDLYRDNIKRMAKESGYQLREVNMYNYFNFVSKVRALPVTRVLEQLEQRMNEETLVTGPLHSCYEQVRKTLIMLLVLEEHGGIIITERLAIVQDLVWIENIARQHFVNRGNPKVVPKVFAFYNMSRSSSRTPDPKKQAEGVLEKTMVRYPGLLPYFIVAVKGSRFIADVLDESNKILLKSDQSIKLRGRYAKGYVYLAHQVNFYCQFFQVASTKVLTEKEIQLEDESFAVDHYGLFSMNAYYGPEKIWFFFEDNQGLKIIQQLSKLDLSELEAQMGKVRYIARFPLYYDFNIFVNETRSRNQFIVSGSYMDKYFYPNSRESFIVLNPQRPQTDFGADSWAALPKIVWLYWNQGLQDASVIYRLCIDNIERYSKQSGFKVNIVNDKNVHQYLDELTIKRIQTSIERQPNFIKSRYMRFDLIRLAIIARHGGVYLDSSYILLENLDWLKYIARYPSNMIFNRFGKQPKVFLFFHPHYGSPFKWTVDPKANTKAAKYLSYQNNFIAAQKNSIFIKDWFQSLLNVIVQDYEVFEKELKQYQLFEHKWFSPGNPYLLPMDVAKYVIAKKQRQLLNLKNQKHSKSDINEVYRIWSMNGYTGQQKLRGHTSFDSHGHDNLFIREFSEAQTEEMLGRVRHLTKLYNFPARVLETILLGSLHHLDRQFHPESIFMKYLYNPQRHSIKPVQSDPTKFHFSLIATNESQSI